MKDRSTAKVGIGIIGAGVISDVYLENLNSRFENTHVVGITDLMAERAKEKAIKHGVLALSMDELLAHPEVDLVINLTIPAAHAEVAMSALNVGKSVYNEKPLAISREDGRKLLEVAKEKGLRVGAAPDTFLGGGLQTARKLLDEGEIGEVVSVSAHMLNHGMEHWHPDPYFFFQPGAGPLFDVGVYYVTAMASMLGPVRRVSALARASFAERTVANGPKLGEKIPVNTPTHIVSALEFEHGFLGSLTTSFDVWEPDHSALMIYGSEGTLKLPDPNTFGGPIKLWRGGSKAWEEIPLAYGNTNNSRGLGVWDLANSMQSGEPHRASGEMSFHVLDIMTAVLESSNEGRHVTVESTFDRPAILPA